MSKKHNNSNSNKPCVFSFADISLANLNVDISLLSAGYVLMFAYAVVMLSRFNVVEQGRRTNLCRICIRFDFELLMHWIG